MCVGKIKHVYVNMNTVSVLNCFNDNKMEKTGREREREKVKIKIRIKEALKIATKRKKINGKRLNRKIMFWKFG